MKVILSLLFTVVFLVNHCTCTSLTNQILVIIVEPYKVSCKNPSTIVYESIESCFLISNVGLNETNRIVSSKRNGQA